MTEQQFSKDYLIKALDNLKLHVESDMPKEEVVEAIWGIMLGVDSETVLDIIRESVFDELNRHDEGRIIWR